MAFVGAEKFSEFYITLHYIGLILFPFEELVFVVERSGFFNGFHCLSSGLVEVEYYFFMTSL